MPKVKFTKPYQVEGTAFQAKRNGLPDTAEDPEDSPAYVVGQTAEVSDASARHFVNRGVAVIVGSKAAKAAEEAEEQGVDYEAMSTEEVQKIAGDRGLEGRGGLNKADLVKLIEKDDKKRSAAEKTAASAAEKSAAAATPATPPAKPK